MAAVYTSVAPNWAQRLTEATPVAVVWYVAYVMKYGENVEQRRIVGSKTFSTLIADI